MEHVLHRVPPCGFVYHNGWVHGPSPYLSDFLKAANGLHIMIYEEDITFQGNSKYPWHIQSYPSHYAWVQEKCLRDYDRSIICCNYCILNIDNLLSNDLLIYIQYLQRILHHSTTPLEDGYPLLITDHSDGHPATFCLLQSFLLWKFRIRFGICNHDVIYFILLI